MIGVIKQAPPMTIGVVVPSFRRHERLVACLAGVRAQTRPPDGVLVVVHAGDADTAALVAREARAWPQVRAVAVERHGLVSALNRGLSAAREDIVAFLDDDAVPLPDWLARLAVAFEADRAVAAVGGRDVVFMDGTVLEPPGARQLAALSGPGVGRVQWFGRMVGNHHLGVGGARDVDFLKGVNMSFRRCEVAAHGFDVRLRGRGAQLHSEPSICLPLRRRGLRVLYDPRIAVLHHPAPRPHGDDRARFDAEAARAGAHNEALQILDHVGPVRRGVYAVWGLLVGTTEAPGLVLLVRQLRSRGRVAWSAFVEAQRGRAAAWRTRRTPRAGLSSPPRCAGPDDERPRGLRLGEATAPR
jgi:hypothetical protein